MSTKIDTRRGEKLENMKNEKEGKSTNTDEEDITSNTTAVTIRFTSFFLADLLCMKWFDFWTEASKYYFIGEVECRDLWFLDFGVWSLQGICMMGKWNECGWGVLYLSLLYGGFVWSGSNLLLSD
jgi:hypothetical protein